jgi:hypothetical protein
MLTAIIIWVIMLGITLPFAHDVGDRLVLGIGFALPAVFYLACYALVA